MYMYMYSVTYSAICLALTGTLFVAKGLLPSNYKKIAPYTYI